jgi:hypothetical protein
MGVGCGENSSYTRLWIRNLGIELVLPPIGVAARWLPDIERWAIDVLDERDTGGVVA